VNKILSFAAIALVAASSITAQTFDDENARIVMEGFQRLSEKQDAQAYASIFTNSGVWDGPHGENAIGPTNIRQSVQLMFAKFGSLVTAEWHVRSLAPDVKLVDVYQRTKARAEDIRDIPVASGSIGPVNGSTVRTTMILRRQNVKWRVVAARVADLRMRHER